MFIRLESPTRTREADFRRMLSVTEDILTFFLGNEFPPNYYTSMGLSHLYYCVFSLFITLHNKFYEFRIDNLYMSKTFTLPSYTHRNCVKVQGVC